MTERSTVMHFMLIRLRIPVGRFDLSTNRTAIHFFVAIASKAAMSVANRIRPCSVAVSSKHERQTDEEWESVIMMRWSNRNHLILKIEKEERVIRSMRRGIIRFST